MGNGSPEKILITNFHCASNRGDAAILEGLSTSLGRTISQNQIVATEFPNSSRYINNIKSIEQQTAPFRIDRPRRTAAYLVGSVGAPGLLDHFQEWAKSELNLEPYHSANIIVGTGGHYLTEIYYPGKLGVLWEMNYCKEIGKPVVLCGQSFGPVRKTPYRQLTQRVLNKVDAITVRDQRSKGNLEALRLNTDIHLTADTAFAMDPNRGSKPLSERRLEKLPSLSGDPAFTISVRDWSHFEEGGMSQYLEAIADLCEVLVKTYDGRVYLLSTCTGLDGYHTDDRITGHRVHDLLADEIKNDVQIVTGEYTPQEIIHMFEDIDFHIGTRMHSLILALLAGTPIVGIEYQFKTTGLMEMFELEEYVILIDDVDSRSLQTLFENGYKNRKKIKKQIEDHLPAVRKAAQQNGEIVADVLHKYY